MKIAIIGPYPLSEDCIRGGVESSVFGLTKALVSAEHIVDVFDFPRIDGRDGVESYPSLNVHRYANSGSHNKDAVLRLKNIVRDIVAHSFDICHIHGTNAFSLRMYLALKQRHLPVLLTVHGLLREEKKQALLRKPSLKAFYQYIVQSRDERKLLEAAQRIIVDTKYVAEKLHTYGLHHIPEIHVIPQGIDGRFYTIQCDPKSRVILSVGAIGARKGHLYTVEMFNLLRSSGVDAKLRIIGSLADNMYFERLKQSIMNSPYTIDISLETNLPREELFEAYTSAKLFVLHSQEESQGIVFAEAMATGLPVVATKVGGIPYVVENGKSGLLCDFADWHTMAEMVKRLFVNQERWKYYSDYARKSSTPYNWSIIADNISKLYLSMIQNNEI